MNRTFGWMMGMLAAVSLTWAAMSASADADLAKQSQNPLGTMISLPLENNTYFEVGPDENLANILYAKPVLPVNFGSVNLINRFVVPLIYLESQKFEVDQQTDVGFEQIQVKTDDQFGLGNIQWQGFLSPANPGKIIWGVGPVLEMPTNTDDALGVDRWSIGPGAVALAMPGNWVVGALGLNLWDFAGEDDEPDVNKFIFQYFINYNLANGWYLSSTPVISANWEADSDDRWTVPFGLGVGRLVKIGGTLPVDVKVQPFWYAEKPDNGPDWSLQLQVKFLFPK